MLDSALDWLEATKKYSLPRDYYDFPGYWRKCAQKLIVTESKIFWQSEVQVKKYCNNWYKLI